MTPEELFQDLVDHLETALETTPGVEITSKVGYASDMEHGVVKFARSEDEKKCVELKVVYPIRTQIYTNFSQFAESNKKLVELDKEMLSMLKRVKRWGFEYGIKKGVSGSELTYIIRAFTTNIEKDTQSLERISRAKVRTDLEKFWNDISSKYFPSSFYGEVTFRSGKLSVRINWAYRPDEQRNRRDVSDYLTGLEINEIIKKIIKDHPEYNIRFKRGSDVAIEISKNN